ncbi:MAG: carbohydrate kinase family protein [Candidatus Methanofastidiosum sp.]|nr:carbohydrate kinase family protein [Methanofastidiosum sp.]
MKDLLCIGNVNLDTIMGVESFPVVNGESKIEGLEIRYGGSAFNVSVNSSILGLNSGVMASVGNDSDGIIGTLKNFNVDYSNLILQNSPSGRMFIINKENDRMFLFYKGANEKFEKNMINYQVFKEYRFVHVSPTKIEIAEHSIKIAKENSNVVSFDPGEQLCYSHSEEVLKIIKNVDFLFVNRHELSALLGSSDIEEGGQYLKKRRAKNVIVKADKNGVYYFGKNYIHEKAFPTKVIDPTGAGDTFSAAFISNYIGTSDIRSSLRFANAAASFCIQSYGAILKVKKEEIETLYRSRLYG